MKKPWGKLSTKEIRQLQSQIHKRFSDTDINDRFITDGNLVKFKILRKTAANLAGILDADMDITKEDSALRSVTTDQYEFHQVVLIPADEFDQEPKITADDKKAATVIDKEINALKSYYDKGAALNPAAFVEGEGALEEIAGLPTSVDHRPSQSAVKFQASRGTCVAHASCGCLEAFPHIPDDLSEQYLHYKFNVIENRPQNQDSGIITTNAAIYLARPDGKTCLESDWPYIPNQDTINALVTQGGYEPPQTAINNQTYGISSYKIITDIGLTGESIKNTLFLEALLYQGYNIVVGVWVSWDDKDNNGILDPVLDSSGNPIGKGGHAMLIVGYDRANQYFIVKNSWDVGWGHNGYAYLHYNFARSCFKYGYIVKEPTPLRVISVPAKLLQAPFSTQPISRTKLRTAILAIKTSRGRYAVCDAFAGDNLLLKNLVVYNQDGTEHLRRESVIIQGTYLFDIDSGTQTAKDADLWWEAVSPGVNFLVPRNGGAVCVLYDFGNITSQKIPAVMSTSLPVENKYLSHGVLVGRTSSGRAFKALVNPKGNDLVLTAIEVFNPNGSRYLYRTDLKIPSSWTLDVDLLQLGGGTVADLWWHVISNGVSFLEPYSSGKIKLWWSL